MASSFEKQQYQHPGALLHQIKMHGGHKIVLCFRAPSFSEQQKIKGCIIQLTAEVGQPIFTSYALQILGHNMQWYEFIIGYGSFRGMRRNKVRWFGRIIRYIPTIAGNRLSPTNVPQIPFSHTYGGNHVRNSFFDISSYASIIRPFDVSILCHLMQCPHPNIPLINFYCHSR